MVVLVAALEGFFGSFGQVYSSYMRLRAIQCGFLVVMTGFLAWLFLARNRHFWWFWFHFLIDPHASLYRFVVVLFSVYWFCGIFSGVLCFVSLIACPIVVLLMFWCLSFAARGPIFGLLLTLSYFL